MKRIETRIAWTASAALLVQGCSGSSGGDADPPAPPPNAGVQISIAGAAMDEGNSAAGTLVFQVSLSATAAGEVTVSYATNDGTATSAADYAATSGVLRIPAGTAAAQISVPVTGDIQVEGDETFVVTLSLPSSNATLATAAATGTIRNDDDAGGPPAAVGNPLNDTGVAFCSNGVNNRVACNDVAVGTDQYPRQDAQAGRDATANDPSDGHAGFSFTKLDANGAPLTDQSVGYANTPWDCVRDNVTGLVWETKKDDGGVRDRDSSYSWYNSTGIGDGGSRGKSNGGVCNDGGNCDTETYAALINDARLCGREGWRLPTRSELFSLINHGAPAAPFLDTTFIANGLDVSYWTSHSFETLGLAVDAQRAALRRVPKDQALRVQLVTGRMP